MRDRTAHVTIRSRQAADDTFIQALSERVFAPYSKDPRASMRWMLAERGAEVAVAEIGRTRMGFALLGFERLGRDFGPWTRPLLARLNAIAVRPGAEGRGIGRSLLAWAEEASRTRGAVSLTLSTAETNTRARRLFETAGFMPTARLADTYAGRKSAIAMFKAL